MNLFFITLFVLVLTIVPSVAFAETVMDKDVFTPGSQFDSKPLDEAEQEQQDLTDIWVYSIIIVVVVIFSIIGLFLAVKGFFD